MDNTIGHNHTWWKTKEYLASSNEATPDMQDDRKSSRSDGPEAPDTAKDTKGYYILKSYNNYMNCPKSTIAGMSKILLWFGHRRFAITNDITAAYNGMKTGDIEIDLVYGSTSTKDNLVSVPQTMKVKRRKGITTGREVHNGPD